jgi:hypothetical protein
MSEQLSTGDREFDDMAHAFAAYLEANGWRAVVVGNPRAQQQPEDAGSFNYEFVLRFTGGRKNSAAP